MKEVEIFENNLGQKMEVLNRFRKPRVNAKSSHNMATVKFLDTGTVKEVYVSNLTEGKVRDDYAISVYGVGYLGLRKKGTQHYNQAKQLWLNMMKRCYSTKDTRGYHGAVVVDPRWHCLATFIEDIQHLENFEKWVVGNKSSCKYELDKDYNSNGTVYSRYTCRFTTEYENRSFGGKNARAWDERYGGTKPQHKILTRDLARI